MRFMQIESVLQTINRSEPAKNRFSVALIMNIIFFFLSFFVTETLVIPSLSGTDKEVFGDN